MCCDMQRFHSGAPAARRAAKRSPILIMGEKRKPMSWFSHGYVTMASGIVRGRVCTTTELVNMARHTPKRAYSLGLPCTSLILDIHVMINWHLSKQGFRRLVSHDHIAGLSLLLIEVACFCEVNRWTSASFPIGSRARARLTCLKLGPVSRKPRKLFGPVKPMLNHQPYDCRAVLFTYS